MSGVVFGVGSGRCGTLGLAKGLGGIEAVKPYHEGVAASAMTAHGAPPGGLGHLVVSSTLTSYQRRWNLSRLKNRERARSRTGKIIVDVSHYFSSNMDLIAEVFEKPILLLRLHRDIYEVVNSFLWKTRLNPVYSEAGSKVVDYHPKRWICWPDSFAAHPEARNRAEAFACHWIRTQQALDELSMPEFDILHIPTTDLGTRAPWIAVAAKLGRPLLNGFEPPGKVNIASRSGVSDEVREACDRMLRELDYQPCEDWR